MDDPHTGRTQEPTVDGVTVLHHTHDGARGLRIIVRFDHCFMQRRIKALTQCIDFADSEPFQRML